ncbi:MAG TPA: hypothetical protein VMU59_12665 [Caulobacteraceae bacterium]|nr:hypothetical protein [Caulobacteraceae bacterium]
MTAPLRLYFAEVVEADPEPQPPTVFVRTLSVPPGAPWDQARVARLEAQAGAPLPLNDVFYRLFRLDGWRPGHAARYAACYVRAEEAGAAFQAKVEVGGRTLQVRFLSAKARNRRALRLGAAAVATAVLAFLAGGAVTSALSLRAEVADRLAVVERMAAVDAHAAQGRARANAQARLLDAEGVRGRSLTSVLSDLAWASSAKMPGATIEAVHWDRGALAVEVRGEGAPFAGSERALVKQPKPLRPGVRLWTSPPAGRPGQDGRP